MPWAGFEPLIPASEGPISANNFYNDINKWVAEKNHKNVNFISCTPHHMGLFYDDQNKEAKKDKKCIMHNGRK
jgi:hypothetical protein